MTRKKNFTSKKPLISFVLGTLTGIAVFLLTVLIFSVLMTKKEVPDILHAVFLLSAVFAGALTSAFFVKRRLRQQGIIPIVISAACFIIPVLIVILSINLFSVSLMILSVLPVGAVGAFLGGITAAKLK